MTQFRYSQTLAVFIAVLWFSTPSVSGQEMFELQVTTTASQTQPIELSLEALDALDQIEFTTTTIWTEGEIKFSGVPLRTLLDHLGADGTTLEMFALDDYSVSIPIADIDDDAPIIATRMNDETISVRDKGPYWIVYPYDQNPEYRTEEHFTRSIWQLNRLKVVE